MDFKEVPSILSTKELELGTSTKEHTFLKLTGNNWHGWERNIVKELTAKEAVRPLFAHAGQRWRGLRFQRAAREQAA